MIKLRQSTLARAKYSIESIEKEKGENLSLIQKKDWLVCQFKWTDELAAQVVLTLEKEHEGIKTRDDRHS